MSKINKVEILKAKDDDIALRISAGSGHDLKNAYIVYRGDMKKIKKLFKRLSEAFDKLAVEAEQDPREDWNNENITKFFGKNKNG